MTIDLEINRKDLSPKLRQYVERLESALGEDTFDVILDEIKRDKTVKMAEAKALARAMTGVRARSKHDAFTLLRMRHANIVGTRARMLAIGGRIAA